MFAYIDETGNTGSNVFDEAQPDFFAGALITKTEFDLAKGSAIRSLCAKHGFAGLHASVIGLGGIEPIADSILRIVKDADARFFISRVEKRYLVASKIFDTFFDSGENPAAPWVGYNFRLLRLTLCFKVAALVTDEIARRYWAMLMEKNEQKARAMIPEICGSFLARIQIIPDQRSREIVTQALTWSRDHPNGLNIYISGRQAKNGHMPNMVAFANLLDGLEHFSKRWNRRVRKIIHDRQSQFESTLEEWHRMYSTAPYDPIELPGETFVFQKVVDSSFEVSSSEDSPGIQVADVALWLFRQMLAGRPLPEKSTKLLRFILKRSWQNDFSFSGVGRSAEELYQRVMNAPISDEALARAADISAEMETQRLQAVALYEMDGFMPYERKHLDSIRKAE